MSLAVLLLLQVATGQPQTGQDVVARMHDRWQGKWFRTFTFVQRTTFPDRPAQTWYETIQNPGRLRIDFGPIDSMNTAIIKNDSVYQFKRGQPAGNHPSPNTLGIVLSDVYAQPVAETTAQLERHGVSLSKLRADTLRGQRVWVIGAAAGDSTSPQLLGRSAAPPAPPIHESGPGGKTLVGDVLRRAPGAIPVETEMVFRENGKEIQREQHTQLTFDTELDPSVFETGEWERPGWIRK
jgi:hypothetical protein